jgi:hypothetical protein
MDNKVLRKLSHGPPNSEGALGGSYNLKWGALIKEVAPSTVDFLSRNYPELKLESGGESFPLNKQPLLYPKSYPQIFHFGVALETNHDFLI